MATKEEKALERLIKKLSALRETLRGDERDLLDKMVVGAQSEVNLHEIPPESRIPWESKVEPAAQDAAQARTSVEDSEVNLHEIPPESRIPWESKVEPAAQEAAQARTSVEDSEVALHAVDAEVTPGAAELAAEPRIQLRVTLDDDSGEYFIRRSEI